MEEAGTINFEETADLNYALALLTLNTINKMKKSSPFVSTIETRKKKLAGKIWISWRGREDVKVKYELER
ncbi:unnamed protein product [Onchocerca flexuosa]|uniref:Uncharacterized protein n=1 Tax=Onchocerca flexuosa TaxID=387005 RepID=A0A183I3L0_9BILA|nr:unnamed protein product [Onchocerca flexuosa]